MSVDRCDQCGRIVDTDKDPDCYVRILEGKKLETVDVLCEPCRDRLLEQKDLEDAVAALGEQQAGAAQ